MKKLSVNDRFEEAVSGIISLMETEGTNWVKGWKNLSHHNPVSGSKYRGINPFILALASMKNGWTSKYWATYKQLKQKGWRIKSSQVKESIPIFFYSMWKKEDEETGEIENIPVMKVFYVYNFDQLEQSEETLLGHSSENEVNPEHEAIFDEVVDGLGIEMAHGNPAFYPQLNRITMPSWKDYHMPDERLSDFFHEVGHWTGHESRLDRNMSVFDRNSVDYAFEELVAELSSCILCDQFGISKSSTNANHAKYLNGWIAHLKEHPKALYRAASAASKASEFVLTELGKLERQEHAA